MTKASNMGDMGDMGDIGSVGYGNGGDTGTAVLPDRVNLPFNIEAARVWNKDTKEWEYRGTELGKIASMPATMPTMAWLDRDWQGRWAAWRVLAEYAATDWRSIQITPWPEGPDQDTELEALTRAAQDERADALGEIVAQNASYEDIMAYFFALLRVSSKSHPKMAQLLHVAGLAGILSAMYFKGRPGGESYPDKKPRLRPSQLRPALMPPIDIPGHPSFPSGHATQAMLMALCIEETLPTQLVKDQWRPFLHTLAGRIARNREIAGLHFESDSRGGFELAAKAFDKLYGCPAFKDVVTGATKEWTENA